MHSGRDEKETKEGEKKKQIFAFNLTIISYIKSHCIEPLIGMTNARTHYSSGYCVYQRHSVKTTGRLRSNTQKPYKTK